MLLHSVGTHPVEERYVTLAVTMRRGVLNNMSSEILSSAVPRETCRWPTVCPRPDHATFNHQQLFQRGVSCVRYARRHTLSLAHSVGCAKLHLLLRCSHVVAVADEVQVL